MIALWMILLTLGAWTGTVRAAPLPPLRGGLPPAAALLLESQGFRPADSKALIEGREVLARARLEALPGGRRQRYAVKSVMLVHSGLKTTRDWMSRFDRFAGLVPYVHRSDWNPGTGHLELEGGVWNYFLSSTLKFTEKTPEHWMFEVVRGHFFGMRGEIRFETAGPGRTLVVLGSQLEAERFPPKWLIERGAEFVFAVTGRRVRSSIESPIEEEEHHGRTETSPPAEVPQPRKRLR